MFVAQSWVVWLVVHSTHGNVAILPRWVGDDELVAAVGVVLLMLSCLSVRVWLYVYARKKARLFYSRVSALGRGRLELLFFLY